MGAAASVKDVQNATPDQVASVIEGLGANFKPYAKQFRDDGVDGATIIEMGPEEVFDEMGITKKFHRKRMQHVFDNATAKAAEGKQATPKATSLPAQAAEGKQAASRATSLPVEDGGAFPNVGVHIKVLERALGDRRLQLMYCEQTFVSTGIYGERDEVVDVVDIDLNKLDDDGVRNLAQELRVYSHMDYAGEFPYSKYPKDTLLKTLRGKRPSTTCQVNICYIKPETKRAGCSFARKLVNEGSELVAEPTVFLSHAWRYDFRALVAVARLYAESQAEDVFFWNDIFVEDQNSAAAKPDDYWFNGFKTAVERIGRTVLVLFPWNAPIVLTRAWCIWEIFATVAGNKELHVLIPPDQQAAFERALVEDYDSIVRVLSDVDSANAEMFDPGGENLKRFKEAVQTTLDGGFATLNNVVCGHLRNWLLRTVLHVVETRYRGEDLSVEDQKSKALLFNQAAMLLKSMGKLEECVPLFKKAITIWEKTGSPNLAVGLNRLAQTLQKQGKFDEAIELFLKALAIKPDYADALDNLAGVYLDQGKLDKAEPLYRQALAIASKIHGNTHPDTQNYAIGLLNVLDEVGGHDDEVSQLEHLHEV